ncbi:MAG TPA: GTPase ObgE [Candidatus Udaeobacter sp.]|jgi:GTP-binding protein|nr:GTPase ObgE [Candidatus Udaeobacter sp.]
MLVDHARIHVVAGHGGSGSVSFRREKYVPKGGPDGGDGGRGGSVILCVDPHVRTLLDCREQPRYRADSGRSGAGANRSGKDGEDLVIRVPRGTVIKDAESGAVLADLVRSGDTFVAATGGRGGRGNARFATATHQAPRRAEPGGEGQERRLDLELKLIADVGLVGLPNAGKSTLLSRISRARPKIADYPFTTLEPNLGIVSLDEERQFVVADVPGIIEGAHEGRGLGIQFLRHLERTRALALLIDVTSEDARADRDLLLREMREYSDAFAAKPRIEALTKSDLLPPEARPQAAREAGLPEARLISAHSGDGVRALLEELWALIAPETVSEARDDERHDG